MITFENLFMELKKKCKNDSIKITEGIKFEYDESFKTLYMRMKDGIKKNMQEDSAAFEGWALAFKANLQDHIDYIILDWDEENEPLKQTKTDWRHFNRFLYRVEHFCNNYGNWFKISNDKECWTKIRGLEGWTKLVLNKPGYRDAEKKLDQINTKSEHAVEEYFKTEGSRNLLAKTKEYGIEIEELHSQYPVGVFSEKVSKHNYIFTGGKSAIDLYGIDRKNRSFNIFELKAENNAKIGIVSELFFYSSIIKDAISGDMEWDEANIMKDFYVNAFFLVPRIHPLITDDVIDLLNTPKNGVVFRKLIYSLKDICIEG